MFREMRRQDRLLSKEETWNIVEDMKYGVLSLIGDDGYPYGVPMHYVIIDNTIYMHGTNESGHKLDAMKKDSKMCFTICDMETDTKGKSVIMLGNITIVDSMKEAVLEMFVETHVPEFAWEQAKSGIVFAKDNIEAYSLSIDHISGKRIDKPEGR